MVNVYGRWQADTTKPVEPTAGFILGAKGFEHAFHRADKWPINYLMLSDNRRLIKMYVYTR